MPETGYHIRWHGLFMEEARGITLHGLHTSRNLPLAMNLLGQQLNRTQVGIRSEFESAGWVTWIGPGIWEGHRIDTKSIDDGPVEGAFVWHMGPSHRSV